MSAHLEVDVLETPEGQGIRMLIDMMPLGPQALHENGRKTLGCSGLSLIGTYEPVTSAAWCRGQSASNLSSKSFRCEGSPQFFAPLSLICPQACGCFRVTAPHCPSSCRSCGDQPLPPTVPVADCAAAVGLGVCGTADGRALCPATCGVCNGTAPPLPCVDGTLPPGGAPGLENCSQLKARDQAG